MLVSVALSRRSVLPWVASLVFGAMSLNWAEPAAAQKAQFDRKKPHVNVSGDAADTPESLVDSQAPSGGRSFDGADILVVDIVDSFAAPAIVGAQLALVVRDPAARSHETWLATTASLSYGVVVLDEPLDTARDEQVVSAWLVLFDDAPADASTIATHGYIRIKKLNSGG